MTQQGSATDVRVTRDDEQGRFNAYIGDEFAGAIEYELGDGVIVMIHTEVDPEHQGQGVASRLVAGALDQVRDAGLKVAAQCSYVASFLREHPEYADLE